MSESKVFVNSSEASDRWSESSGHPTSLGAATWSVTDSNAELIVPRVTLEDNEPRSMGHLRIMVCGDSGIGKTRLIQSLITPGGSTKEEVLFDGYAVQETRIALDAFELCFVDTPGYGACLDAESVIAAVAHYVERQFQRTNTMLNPMHANTQELQHLVHNPYGAHSHVDCCLYVILDRVKRVDIEYMRALQEMCNVIPIIISRSKSAVSLIQLEMEEHSIEMFDIYAAPDIAHVSCDRLFTRVEALRRLTTQKFVHWRASQHLVLEDEDDLSLSASTLTTAETVDRIHALRTRHVQNMNLFISRYVSEKRKSMERDMFERERALRQELASVERRKRAGWLMTELNHLFEQGPLDDLTYKAPVASNNSSTSVVIHQPPSAMEERRNGLIVCALVLIIAHLLLDLYQVTCCNK